MTHNHGVRAAVLRVVVCVAWCIAISAVPLMSVRAQTRNPQAITSRADTSRAADAPGGWHLEQCIAGLTYGTPLRWALSYGGGLLHEPVEGRDICVLMVGKIGFGGVQASAGVGSSFGAVGGGAMVTANLLRTFGAPRAASPRSTYAGASLHLWPLLGLGGEVGYYVRLSDAANAPSPGKRFVGWSAGFGF